MPAFFSSDQIYNQFMAQLIAYKGFGHVLEGSGPWLWWLVGFYFCLPILGYVVLPYLTSKPMKRKRRSIAIMVLGDLGHSPRMCYHAKSFLDFNYYVSLCGYLESEPSDEIVDDANIDIEPIEVIKNTMDLPYLVFIIQKVVLQTWQLFSLLMKFKGVDFIMIQNPPLIPILLLAIVFIRIFSKDTRLIIDWHNLNYSILNLRYRNLKHPLVRLVRFYELFLGRWADFNITVTKQMNKFLSREFGIDKKHIVTLYDRPAEQFVPFARLNIKKEEVFRNHDLFNDIPNIDDYKIVVSSTSFTPDEDFNTLLDALAEYHNTPELPPLLVIITGKGPMRAQFLQKVDDLAFTDKVIVRNAWLSTEDYPIILSMADVAVSLHTSSSGIDLPMKIVDFFGCGVPVISLNFSAIGELVKDGVNGFVTSEKGELSQEIFRLLRLVFTEPQQLAKIKDGAMEESENRWETNWNHVMKQFRYDAQ